MSYVNRLHGYVTFMLTDCTVVTALYHTHLETFNRSNPHYVPVASIHAGPKPAKNQRTAFYIGSSGAQLVLGENRIIVLSKHRVKRIGSTAQRNQNTSRIKTRA